jgi:diaminopimelate decarboxylase
MLSTPAKGEDRTARHSGPSPCGPYEPAGDPQSPNRNLTPITTRLDERGRLEVGGCRLSDLAHRYGTPLYVLDEATLRQACRAYREALRRHYPGEALALYASKANSVVGLVALVASEGLGLDAVSAGELLTALEGGMPAERIVLHGNNKSRDELELSVRAGVTVVVDNWLDLELLEDLAETAAGPVRLMVRFTPGIECHTHEYIRTGHLDSKFGFDPDELEPVLRHLARCPWAVLDGLHAHIGSQIFEVEPHRDLAGVMADALALARSLGHPCGDLNVGGGLGIRYLPSDDPPSIEGWVRVVAEAVASACRARGLALPRLLCEPGRSLVATAGVTLYTVGSRKAVPGLRSYVAVDGGMSDNPRPITYRSRYTALVADRPLEPAEEPVTVVGKHCESGDVLLPEADLPPVSSGDVLAVFSTGAYNASMGSNYNRIPRPATVLVNEGEVDLLQRRERPEELLRYDLLPARLRPVT